MIMETNNATSTAITRTDAVPLGAIIVATQDRIGSLSAVGDWVSKSGMFGCNALETGRMIAIQCVEEGLKLSEWPRIYHLINGRPQKKAHAAQAEFEAKGGTVEWIELGRDGKKASATLTFPGKKPLTIEFSIDQAARAGLLKNDSNWAKWPDRMLRAAVLREGILILAPSIYAGCYDELDAPAGPSLNLAPEKPAAVAEVVTSAPATATPPTIEAKVEVLPDTPKARQTPTPAPATAAPKAAPTVLPDALQFALMDVIGNDPTALLKATEFCRAQKWITADEGMENLPEGRAREIIARQDHFRKKVLGVGGAK